MDRRTLLKGGGVGAAALLGVPATATLLTGCGGSTGSDGSVALDFPTWQADEDGVKEWLRQRVDAFQGQNANVTINLQQVPYANYTDTLTQRFAANKPPEIVHLPTTTFGSFASQGWLTDLDDRLAQTDILDNWTPIQKTLVWDDSNQGVLLLGYAPVLYYNKKLFDDAGIEVPKTLSDLVSAGKELTRGGVKGYGGTTSSHPGVYSETTWFAYGAGGGWSRGESLTFTDDKTLTAIEAYRTLSRYAPKGVPAEQKRKLFFDGNVAMMIEGPYAYASVADAKVSDQVEVAAVPFENQPGFPSNSIHIPASLDDDKAEIVWSFIKSLTTPEAQADYARLYHVPAPRKNVITKEIIDKNPELELFQKVTEDAVVASPDNQQIVANFGEVQKLIIDAGVRLQTTSDPTETVMSDLQQKVSDAIKS